MGVETLTEIGERSVGAELLAEKHERIGVRANPAFMAGVKRYVQIARLKTLELSLGSFRPPGSRSVTGEAVESQIERTIMTIDPEITRLSRLGLPFYSEGGTGEVSELVNFAVIRNMLNGLEPEQLKVGFEAFRMAREIFMGFANQPRCTGTMMDLMDLFNESMCISTAIVVNAAMDCDPASPGRNHTAGMVLSYEGDCYEHPVDFAKTALHVISVCD